MKEIKEKIKEIVEILNEEYGHQDACDRNPDRICSCPIGLVVDKLEEIQELFPEYVKEIVEEIRLEDIMESGSVVQVETMSNDFINGVKYALKRINQLNEQ